MSKCPACKRDFARRQNEACPHCGTALQLYNGVYFRADVGNPVEAFFKYFEEKVSAQASAAQGIPVYFHISKKTTAWKREHALAQKLLALCDYDLDLALATLDVLFENKQFSFKTRSSLLHCTRDFPLAMAVAKAALDIQKRQEQRAAETLRRIEQQEDIWR